MYSFIKVIDKGGNRRCVNSRYIEEVVEVDENRCFIYMAFNSPNAYEQDYIEVNMPYNEMLNVLAEARG